MVLGESKHGQGSSRDQTNGQDQRGYQPYARRMREDSFELATGIPADGQRYSGGREDEDSRPLPPCWTGLLSNPHPVPPAWMRSTPWVVGACVAVALAYAALVATKLVPFVTNATGNVTGHVVGPSSDVIIWVIFASVVAFPLAVYVVTHVFERVLRCASPGRSRHGNSSNHRNNRAALLREQGHPNYGGTGAGWQRSHRLSGAAGDTDAGYAGSGECV